jgi:hypothetical protein
MAEPSYYYTANEKVPIEPDPGHVAIDFAPLHQSASTKLRLWLEKHQAIPALRGELRLIERATLPDPVYAEIKERSALHPVYRYGDTLLIVLPEVRVEGRSKAHQDRIRAFVENGSVRASVESRNDGQLILRPVSGKGSDALVLANAVHENLHPPMAQARFLRVVPSPVLTHEG